MQLRIFVICLFIGASAMGMNKQAVDSAQAGKRVDHTVLTLQDRIITHFTVYCPDSAATHIRKVLFPTYEGTENNYYLVRTITADTEKGILVKFTGRYQGKVAGVHSGREKGDLSYEKAAACFHEIVKRYQLTEKTADEWLEASRVVLEEKKN